MELMDRECLRKNVRGELNEIESRLDAAYGAGAYPKTLVVDLHGLLYTLEKAVATMKVLIEADSSVDSAESSVDSLRDVLYALEILVEDDIPMIVADVLPVLKRLHVTDDDDDDGS